MLRPIVSRRPWTSFRLAEQPLFFTTRRHQPQSHSTASKNASPLRTPVQSILRQTSSVFRLATGIFITLHIYAEHFYDLSHAYGISMLPTMNSYGDTIVTSKWYRRGRGIQTGDLVSYRHPVKRGERAIKRVIGLPGDFVLQGTPGDVEGQMIQIPEGHCWVVGDNLGHSRDSRHFGPLPLALVTGKIVSIVGTSYPFFRSLPDAFVAD